MVLAPTEQRTPLGDEAHTQEAGRSTRSGRECDERPKGVVWRLNDAEVWRVREGRDRRKMERLGKLQRRGWEASQGLKRGYISFLRLPYQEP